MSRLMSVAYTEPAVLTRTKTVTCRKGWWRDRNGRALCKPGDRITLCRKVMGRKPGEPLVRICDVEVVSVRRESLWLLADPTVTDYARAEVAREGLPGMHPGTFVTRFFASAQGIMPTDEVTRIEWKYL